MIKINYIINNIYYLFLFNNELPHWRPMLKISWLGQGFHFHGID